MQILMTWFNAFLSHYISDLIGQMKLFDSHYIFVLQSFFWKQLHIGEQDVR